MGALDGLAVLILRGSLLGWAAVFVILAWEACRDMFPKRAAKLQYIALLVLVLYGEAAWLTDYRGLAKVFWALAALWFLGANLRPQRVSGNWRRRVRWNAFFLALATIAWLFLAESIMRSCGSSTRPVRHGILCRRSVPGT